MPASIVIVAAVARNSVIGKDNRLPWRLPEDLAHFKALTTGHAVIMGRKTWESLPPKFRPLPNRCNIVVTHDAAYAAPGAVVATSLPAAIAAAGGGDAYIIGGAQIYAEALTLADRLELTEIDASFEGDAFLPAFDRTMWREAARERHRAAAGFDYAFVSYRRDPR